MALATGQITINNIEETISVVFSKDNHVFPGEVSSALAGSADISVKAYIGTEEVAYTFGSVTPATPTGLTITPNSTSKKITLTATGSLTQASGTYNVQVVVRGVTITKTLSYTISFKGTPGKGISSTEITYQAHTNGTAAPTGAWLANPPAVADNQYLWTRTIITYTDTTTSTSYSVGKMGRGGDGADAKLATIVASSKIFKSRDGGATFSPNSITLTPVFQGGLTYLNWQYSTNGGSTWTTVTTQNGLSINSTTKILTVLKTSTLFTTLITDIVFRVNTNDSTVYDTVNITKVYDVVDLTQQAIFDKLTNNGAEQGIFLDAGKLYLNGEYLKVSNLVAGDTLIQNGYINTAVIETASITSAKIASLAADKIVAKSITTNQLSSEVGQNLDLSSNTSISLRVQNEVTEQVGTAPIYTWIKYADNAQGTGITDNPTGKTYIGIASGKTTATESNDPAAYTWSKFEGPQGAQGIQGPKGTDGTTYYTWIKYADTPTSGMNDFPDGKTYMGIAHNKTTATESLSYGDYTWSLIKGTDGLPGSDGADGVTTYTWVKYADTDTGAGMDDSPTGKRYIGLAFNKTTATKSTKASDYQWSPLYDNVQVGGRNYILNSHFDENDFNGWSSVYGTQVVENSIYKKTFTSLSSGARIEKVFQLNELGVFTFSIFASIPKNIEWRGFVGLSFVSVTQEKVEGYSLYSVTFENTVPGNKTIRGYLPSAPIGSEVLIDWEKLEKGNIPTDWTPAPEDIQEKVTTLSASVDVLAGEVNLKASKTEVTNETKDLVASSIVEYYLSTSSTSPVGGSWSVTAPAWVNGRFMWSRTKVTTKAGAVSYHPNANGTNITGASGATGRGITSTAIHYAVSSSGTVTPTSWGTTVPTVAPEQYLWTRTTINYDSGSPSVSYSIGQAGKSGTPGAPGSPGADGRSLTSSALHYQKSTSGTTVPTGSWLTSIPTVAASEYLWTRTTFNYSSAPTPTYAYSVGKMGDTGRGIDSITPQYYLSTSNTTQINGSWGTTPPAFNKDKYLWTRSYIVWNNPAGTSTTTPVLSTEWNTLADHEVRVYNAEQKITPTAIENTVSERTDVNGDPLFAKTSVVKQTVDNWTATFSQIGGRNVLLNSRQNLTNNTYQHSDYPLGTETPKEGDIYTVTVKFSLGADRTGLDLYASNGYRKQVGFTSADRDSNGVASKTFSVSYYPGRTPADGYSNFSLYQTPNGGTSNSTVEWIKLEKGKVSTDWTPNPDELYTGVTKIDKDGVEVSRSDSDIKSKLAYDGITVTNGTDNIAVFGETTYMPYANIDTIDSLDVVGTVRETMSLQIGEGKDYTTVSEALDVIFKGGRTTLLYDTNINFYLNGNITDEVILKGIEGNGRIYIWFNLALSYMVESGQEIVRFGYMFALKLPPGQAGD